MPRGDRKVNSCFVPDPSGWLKGKFLKVVVRRGCWMSTLCIGPGPVLIERVVVVVGPGPGMVEKKGIVRRGRDPGMLESLDVICNPCIGSGPRGD